METQRLDGIVWSLGRRGYGWIRTPGIKDHVFLLRSAPNLTKGKSVTFVSAENPGSNYRKAVDIRLLPPAA